MTDRARIASAIASARRLHATADVPPPTSLFDPPPPAHTPHHKQADRSELRASQRALVNAGSWKGKVLTQIRQAGAAGATTFEIHQALGGRRVVDFDAIQPRTTDLKRDGLIVATDKIRTTTDPDTGRSHDGTVWVANEWSGDGTTLYVWNGEGEPLSKGTL